MRAPSRWACARAPCWRRPKSCCGAPSRRCFASRCGAPSSPTSRSFSAKPRAAPFKEKAQVKTHVRVLVIGGGVVGVSTLYHLTRKGWTDVALIERTELTAGSTWHAAGLLPLFNMSYTVGQLHKYSVDLYKRLPQETGQDVSFHVTGNLRLATCKERMDEYQKYCGTANTIGVPFEVIGPARVKELWPLIELGGSAETPAIIGALYHPHDGHIAPADLTMALRKGARSAGAENYEHTEALGMERTAGGERRGRSRKHEGTPEHLGVAARDNAPPPGAGPGLYLG